MLSSAHSVGNYICMRFSSAVYRHLHMCHHRLVVCHFSPCTSGGATGHTETVSRAQVLPVHFHSTSNSLPSCSYTAAYGPDLASFTYHSQHVTAQTEQVVGTQVLAEWNVLQASTDLKLACEPVGRISSVSVRYTELLPLVVWKSPT